VHCDATRREDSRPWGKVTVRVFPDNNLKSLSANSALESSRELQQRAEEAVTRKSFTSSIELLTSDDAFAFLTSSITSMTIPACSRAAHTMLPAKGALVEGEGLVDGCSRAAPTSWACRVSWRDFYRNFGMFVDRQHPGDFPLQLVGRRGVEMNS